MIGCSNIVLVWTIGGVVEEVVVLRLDSSRHNAPTHHIIPIAMMRYICRFDLLSEVVSITKKDYFLKNHEINKIPEVTKIIPTKNSLKIMSHRRRHMTPIRR